ncbi:hypothetical protein GEMRC1_010793 [Eukaryota sp. GEM-RC1]
MFSFAKGFARRKQLLQRTAPSFVQASYQNASLNTSAPSDILHLHALLSYEIAFSPTSDSFAHCLIPGSLMLSPFVITFEPHCPYPSLPSEYLHLFDAPLIINISSSLNFSLFDLYEVPTSYPPS